MNGTSGADDNFIVTDRGGIVETTHRVHAAVVDQNGKLLYSVGDPTRIALLRSAAKPAQAFAVLETGAGNKYGFDERDVALMCASHNAEEKHLTLVRSMLEEIDADEDDLKCGGHLSINPAVSRAWIKQDVQLTSLYNNCSGKHAGMLAGAKALGAGTEGYHLLNHPMQQRVKHAVEQLCGSKTDVQWAIDGCNLPAPAMPLKHGAQIFATLARAADASGKHGPSKRYQSLATIFWAMSNHPDLVAGQGRFCTELMQAYQGALVGKVGADGYYGVAIRASEHTRKLGVDGAIGVAVKIEDGNREILYAAVMEILNQLRIGPEDMRRKLDHFHHPKRLNTMDVEIGQVQHIFRLQRCSP